MVEEEGEMPLKVADITRGVSGPNWKVVREMSYMEEVGSEMVILFSPEGRLATAILNVMALVEPM